jgi:hypothetical protein
MAKAAKEQNKTPEKSLWRSPTNKIGFILLLFFLICFTLWKFTLVDHQWFESDKESDNPGICYDYADITLYILWLIGPPLFFLCEYVYFFGKNPLNRFDPDQVNDLKYTQELGSKIWTALSICFSILLYIRYGFKFS